MPGGVVIQDFRVGTAGLSCSQTLDVETLTILTGGELQYPDSIVAERLQTLAQAPRKAFGQAVTLERLNNKINEDTRL
jgi:hypothetical protein